jgi:hypothetical protein
MAIPHMITVPNVFIGVLLVDIELFMWTSYENNGASCKTRKSINGVSFALIFIFQPSDQKGQLHIQFHIDCPFQKSEACLNPVNALATVCRFRCAPVP